MLQSMGLQRVRRDLVAEQQQQLINNTKDRWGLNALTNVKGGLYKQVCLYHFARFQRLELTYKHCCV